MSQGLHLTSSERAMLAGEAGPGVQKAIEIIVALGRIYGASDLVPVASVQVSGVSYKNLGDAGLAFLEEWAAQGARAQVPATLNPAGMDLRDWSGLGFSEDFAHRQRAVIAAYVALGIAPTCTCTPYGAPAPWRRPSPDGRRAMACTWTRTGSPPPSSMCAASFPQRLTWAPWASG